MDCQPVAHRIPLLRSAGGFTLLEVMVSLVLGMLIVGGVMGGISMSIQYSQRVQKRLYESAVLEAAAQHLLAQPRDTLMGSIILDDFPGAPGVAVQAMRVDVGDQPAGLDSQSSLYRVLLSYASKKVEFSLIIPSEQDSR